MAVEGLRLVLKIGATVFVSYGILKTQAWIAPSYSFVDLQTTGSIMGATAKELFSSLVLVLAVFAGVDYFFQRQEFMKNVRLTKQEAKQEYKEREGDPAIKARIRAIQRDVARKRMMAAVKKADVIVTNPTHIAIAIQYDRENMSAPKVVAKGADFVARRSYGVKNGLNSKVE
jgi:flagellar biosynthetic protein FlhB